MRYFLGLVDYVCPDGGSIDEGIAREAFVETIADLAGAGIADLDSLTADQIQAVLELYATKPGLCVKVLILGETQGPPCGTNVVYTNV